MLHRYQSMETTFVSWWFVNHLIASREPYVERETNVIAKKEKHWMEMTLVR